jgi:hypothetical protein
MYSPFWLFIIPATEVFCAYNYRPVISPAKVENESFALPDAFVGVNVGRYE